jgi:hypothetical protein
MTRDHAEALGHPEGLPAEARPYWPDLGRWPTPSDVRYFRHATRRNPAARLAVLNGLRSWSEIDLAPVWSWTGAFLTVAIAGIGATIVTQVQWVQLIIGATVVGAAYVFLVKLASLNSTADQRRRRAHIWLRALE